MILDKTNKYSGYYILALGIIALFTFMSFMISWQSVASQERHAPIINDSGRQRMYSQRLAFLALYLTSDIDQAEKKRVRVLLSDLKQKMADSHQALMNVDQQYKGSQADKVAIRELYTSGPDNLHQKLTDYFDHLDALLAKEAAGEDFQAHLRYISNNTINADLLTSLNDVVEAHANRSKSSLGQVMMGLTIMCGVIIAVLILTVFFVFRPMERKILAQEEKLLEQNQAITIKNKELSQFAYIASHDLKSPLRKIAI